jgi:hypothetical protein
VDECRYSIAVKASITHVCIDRTDSSLVDLLWHLIPVFGVHGNRILAYATEIEQGPSSSCIP